MTTLRNLFVQPFIWIRMIDALKLTSKMTDERNMLPCHTSKAAQREFSVS